MLQDVYSYWCEYLSVCLIWASHFLFSKPSSYGKKRLQTNFKKVLINLGIFVFFRTINKTKSFQKQSRGKF